MEGEGTMVPFVFSPVKKVMSITDFASSTHLSLGQQPFWDGQTTTHQLIWQKLCIEGASTALCWYLLWAQSKVSAKLNELHSGAFCIVHTTHDESCMWAKKSCYTSRVTLVKAGDSKARNMEKIKPGWSGHHRKINPKPSMVNYRGKTLYKDVEPIN